MKIHSSLYFALTLIVITTAASISTKNDSCSKFDSCHAKLQERTCSCEEDCDIYGTCCHDSNKLASVHSSIPFQCYHQRTFTPVFAKRSCLQDYAGHVGNIEGCFEDDIDEMDVKNNLLVTSLRTKITYWNTHCALCNDEIYEDLERWSIEVFCPPREQVDRWVIRRNLTFDEDKKQWGLDLDGEFVQCVVKYVSPPYTDEVKQCTPNLISSCPADYPKKKIISKCSEYYGERKLANSDKYYRNVHCATCNGVKVKELECPGMRRPEDYAEETDFREMVEEIFTNGNWLENKEFVCSKGFSYDPFRKRCRRVKVKEAPLPIVMDDVFSSSQALKFGILSWLIILLMFLN